MSKLIKPDHKIIYLIPADVDEWVWCDDPTPSEECREDEAIKYIRADVAEQQLSDCQNNHADMVKRNAALRSRPDLPIERVKAVQVLVDDNEKLKKQLSDCKAENEDLNISLSMKDDSYCEVVRTAVRLANAITDINNSIGELPEIKKAFEPISFDVENFKGKEDFK